jgi:hypothetical protein
MPITNMLQNAIKAKSPILGIPIPGEKPFCVRRELFVDSLRGLRLIDAAIQMPLDGDRCKMRLEVWAVSDTVKAHRKFVPLNPETHWQTQSTLREWAERQRKKVSGPKLTPKQKVVLKLQKQLAKLGTPRAPMHPYRLKNFEAQAIRDHDALQQKGAASLRDGGCEITYTPVGAQWAQWKREQPIRRWIQAQARLCHAGSLTSAKLYKTLTERGLTVTKWTELRKHDRMRCKDSFFGYLERLWMYCGLVGRPHWLQADEPETFGAERYAHWLEHLREHKALKAEIEDVQQLPEREKRQRCRAVPETATAVA